jgi:hypothetical protein
MAFASKAQQRMARSTNVRAADSTVNSDTVEMKTMPKSRPDLTGGSLAGKGSDRGALTGGRVGGAKGGTSTLYGSMPSSGKTSAPIKSLCEDSPGKGRTTRESLGRTGQSFAKGR